MLSIFMAALDLALLINSWNEMKRYYKQGRNVLGTLYLVGFLLMFILVVALIIQSQTP